MLRASFLMLVTLVAGMIGYSGTQASAFPIIIQPGLQSGAVSPSITDVRYNGGHGSYHGNYHHRPYYNHRPYWNHSYGRRCNGWTNYCRYRYNGYWYSNQWWIAPAVGVGVGLAIAGSHSSRHVAWCESRDRSYNRRNNTWISNSGQVRKCVSPY